MKVLKTIAVFLIPGGLILLGIYFLYRLYRQQNPAVTGAGGIFSSVGGSGGGGSAGQGGNPSSYNGGITVYAVGGTSAANTSSNSLASELSSVGSLLNGGASLLKGITSIGSSIIGGITNLFNSSSTSTNNQPDWQSAIDQAAQGIIPANGPLVPATPTGDSQTPDATAFSNSNSWWATNGDWVTGAGNVVTPLQLESNNYGAYGGIAQEGVQQAAGVLAPTFDAAWGGDTSEAAAYNPFNNWSTELESTISGIASPYVTDPNTGLLNISGAYNSYFQNPPNATGDSFSGSSFDTTDPFSSGTFSGD